MINFQKLKNKFYKLSPTYRYLKKVASQIDQIDSKSSALEAGLASKNSEISNQLIGIQNQLNKINTAALKHQEVQTNWNIRPFDIKVPQPRPNLKNNKVYFFNDTSFIDHSGCKAVMRSLNYHMHNFKIIGRSYVNQYFYNEAIFEEADIIIVNGEGTLHHEAPYCNFLMDILRKAQSMGKKTALINAVYQNDPSYNADVMKNLDLCILRGPLSLKNAQNAGARNARMLLDSCADPIFLSNLHQKGLFIMAQTSKGDVHSNMPIRHFMNSLDYPHYPMLHMSIPYEYIIETLKTTELIITGQHHCLYAAGLAGIPFVPMKSNSHKIEEIIQWSGLDIPIYEEGENIEEHINEARSNKKKYLLFQEFLLSNRALNAEDLDCLL